MSNAMLVFRGEVAANGDDGIIVEVCNGDVRGARVEISGRLTDATLRVARLATRQTSEHELVEALSAELQLEHDVASSLIAQLIAAGILSAEVKATTRLSFSGHSEIAAQLTRELSSATWPADLPGLTIVVLGTLGSKAWYQELEHACRTDAPVLTCSFEGENTWIGPLLHPRGAGRPDTQAPCPLCLQARRVAAGSADQAEVTLSCPPHLDLVAGQLRQVAELHARGELGRGQVLHMKGASATFRSLLAQPHCVLCDQAELTEFRSLKDRAAAYARGCEAELARSDVDQEPSHAQRGAFLDPELGPLRLEIHDAPGTFRELPLVLGSIRVALRTEHELARREFSSVMFGTGATERRRKLVAFSEGIERYAGVTDQPDIVAVPHRELDLHAVAPEQTVRFSEAQYQTGAAVRHDGQPLDWSWVYDWTSGGAKLLVHDFVSYGRAPRGGARLLDDPFSSGMSAHRSLSLALSRSLLELVERDAFMLAWYLRLPLRELDVSRLADSELHELIAYLAAAGVTLRFHDLRVDFDVPTVLAVAEAQRPLGPWQAGGTILSACAGHSFREAARHAVREILGHYTAFGLVSPDGDKSVEPETGEPRPWWAAFSALLSPRSDAPLGFLRRGDPLLVTDEAEATPLSLRAEMLRRELPVYVRRLGRSDIAESGLVAVRAIIPGLVRMTPTRESVNFGEPRIAQLARRWNVPAELNPMLHPLA